MGNIQDRILRLRAQMRAENVDICVIPTADFHQSEYVSAHFRFREYMTGFTGSAGTAVFTPDEAGLWTDGRYFIQAADELRGSGIRLYRQGEPGVPEIAEYLEKQLSEGKTLGLDGRCISVETGKTYAALAEKKQANFLCDFRAADQVWINRPVLPSGKTFLLGEEYAGESVSSKLARIREKMAEQNCGVHLVSSLDDIAWILNLRGSDVDYCPVFLSYLLLYPQKGVLFADKDKFPEDAAALLAENNISVRPYGEIDEALSGFSADERVLLDAEKTNFSLYSLICENAEAVEASAPSVLMKSTKNMTEAENIRRAHIKDGVAQTRFMYWLKNTVGKEELTELSVSDKLVRFRALQKGFLGPSFSPISAFGEHGAIVHYSADEQSNASVHPGKLLLMDTGGHYLEGSTDITRTFALGEVSRTEKEDFTLVVRAMLNLANTVFLYGASGANLDCIAREVFWREGKNFNHSTGHGVGYLLNIHEDPIRFQWKEGKKTAQTLEENMVITDEPGIYIEGSHGIRIENELMVKKGEKNAYGQFMVFECLTFVPIDLDAILPEMMRDEEIGWLNAYHRQVREKIGPYLNEEEREWLSKYTREIRKTS